MSISGPIVKLIIRDASGNWLADPDEFGLGEFAGTLPTVGDILIRRTRIGGEPSYQAYRVLERIFHVDRTEDAPPEQASEPGRHLLVVEPTTLAEIHERALGLPPKGVAV